MADRLNNSVLHSPNSRAIGKMIEDMNFQAIMRRRAWERRWYNTNWFDDGLHFRVMSKRTGQIIDHVQRNSGFIERAIPRASKQIRGIGALLLTPDYYPVVYPERTTQEKYRNKMTGQVDMQAFQKAQEDAKETARKRGIFLTTTWEDELELELKLMDMILLTAKNGISYLKVFTDPLTHRINATVHDAFDVICYGDVRELDDLPFMTFTQPIDFNEVISNEMFDEDKRRELSPDNLYATSEIKEAYMRARYGSKLNAQNLNTINIRETFLKEYLSEDNWKQAQELGEENGAMEGKDRGDLIMRHTWSAGGVCLKDEYIDYDNYPVSELRFESGYLYQVPLMERFIPLNKSQDIVVTRIEKWINTMVAGIYRVRKGENMIISNIPGGQKVEYEGTPPDQMPISNVGSTPFQFMEMTDKYIEEQGISSNNVSQLPNNIANNTIENIQQQEYTNMKFATARLKKCVTRIGELIMERADKDYIHPVEISYKEDNNTHYFNVVGSRGKKAYDKVSKKLPDDLVVLNRKAKIRIEADKGFGLTQDGRRQAMETLMKEMVNLYQLGFLGAQAMSLLVKRMVEEYGYGSTEEFMEAIEDGITQGQMSQQQINQMKIAMLQVLKDAKMTGPEMEKKLMDHNTANLQTTQLGVLKTMKDVGLLDKLGAEGKDNIEVDNLVKLYKDASPELRRQIETKLGLQPASDEPISPSQADSAKALHEIVKGTHEMKMGERQQESAEGQFEKEQGNTQQELEIKRKQAEKPVAKTAP
jgi:hypothetical protein